jgi:hypothetical protein
MQGWFGWEFLHKRGVIATRVAAGFEGEEKSSFFPLHVFIPLFKCGELCFDAE